MKKPECCDCGRELDQYPNEFYELCSVCLSERVENDCLEDDELEHYY